jgi:hypothetical protein
LGSTPNFVLCLWFLGLRNALWNSATQAQAVKTAYNSSHQEQEELQAAALEACQGIEEGEAQAGSSLASCLHALGGHVTQRMRRSLHLGVQKALGVVVSHYRVNLGVISTGYVVPVGVDDEVEMNRVDTLAAPTANISPRTSWTSCSQMLPMLAALKPENSWAFVPFMLFVLVFEPRGHVINICYLKHLNICKLKNLLFVISAILAGKVSFARVAYKQSGEGEGSYPARGVGYPRLALLRPLASRVPCKFAQSLC